MIYSNPSEQLHDRTTLYVPENKVRIENSKDHVRVKCLGRSDILWPKDTCLVRGYKSRKDISEKTILDLDAILSKYFKCFQKGTEYKYRNGNRTNITTLITCKP